MNFKAILLALGLSALIIFFSAEFTYALFLGLTLFFYNSISLFNSIVSLLPIKRLCIFFASFQAIFTAYISYYLFPDQQMHSMVIPPDRYFEFVSPAVLMFAFGLYAIKDKHFERINLFSLRKFNFKDSNLYLILAGIGIASSYLPLAGDFAFIQYFLSSLKFAGIFLHVLSSSKINWWVIGIVYVSIFVYSFILGPFHDIIIWTLLFTSIISIRYKPSILMKSIAVIMLCFSVYIIQV